MLTRNRIFFFLNKLISRYRKWSCSHGPKKTHYLLGQLGKVIGNCEAEQSKLRMGLHGDGSSFKAEIYSKEHEVKAVIHVETVPYMAKLWNEATPRDLSAQFLHFTGKRAPQGQKTNRKSELPSGPPHGNRRVKTQASGLWTICFYTQPHGLPYLNFALTI